jgi:hypothetical protein
MTVLYLCDGHACDAGSVYCMTADGCRRTSDVQHALNGPCANPEENPRFTEVMPGIYAECDEVLMAFHLAATGWDGHIAPRKKAGMLLRKFTGR